MKKTKEIKKEEKKDINNTEEIKSSSNDKNIFALIGFIMAVSIVFVVPGIIFSIVGFSDSKKKNRKYDSFALPGLIVSIFVIVSGLIFLIIKLSAPANNTGNNGNNYSRSFYNTTNTDSTKKEEKKKIEVADFGSMSKFEVVFWCEEKNISCYFSEDYSDTVEKGNFLKQSVEAGKQIYEKDYIYIYYSLGKKPTIGQQNALKKAESYSKNLHMSKSGLYKQLTSEYGEGFTEEEAQYAIDNLDVDYKLNALEKAKSYQRNLNMSKSRIYDQLVSEYGEGFTEEEAQYAIDNLPE